MNRLPILPFNGDLMLFEPDIKVSPPVPKKCKKKEYKGSFPKQPCNPRNLRTYCHRKNG